MKERLPKVLLIGIVVLILVVGIFLGVVKSFQKNKNTGYFVDAADPEYPLEWLKCPYPPCDIDFTDPMKKVDYDLIIDSDGDWTLISKSPLSAEDLISIYKGVEKILGPNHTTTGSDVYGNFEYNNDGLLIKAPGYWQSDRDGLWRPIHGGPITPSEGQDTALATPGIPNPPSCTITVDPASVTVGGSASTILTATVTGASGTVQRVEFVSAEELSATVNPTIDNTSPYQTSVKGRIPGSTYVYAYAWINDVTTCVSSSTITVTPGPWWRASDGDLTTSGSISSQIPSTAADKSLILKGAGGYSGVGLYNDSYYFGGGYLATPSGWLVESNSTGLRDYDYNYLASQIPLGVTFNKITNQSIIQADLTSGTINKVQNTTYNGYYWNTYDGGETGLDLSIDSDVNFGNQKVVLMVVNADLNINGKINVTDGAGFFTAIVGNSTSGAKGNIFVSPTVTDLEGIYLSDNTFSTGAGTTLLTIRGSVAALGGISMERDLANDSTPAELFEFAPDQILLFPPQLNIRKYKWREVSP